MCTVSWFPRPGGYELFFNRDERRTRLPAEPPACRHEGPDPYLAPLDGDALGTWVAVNGSGLSLGLLNGFPADGGEFASLPTAPDGRDWISRGHVIPQLVGARDAVEALVAAARLDLARFRPMLVLALDAGGRRGVADWSGRRLDTRVGDEAPRPPLISSSFCTDEVRASRRAAWTRQVGSIEGADAEAHIAFHRGHVPRRGPHSVCMHRPDARTVSFTRIVVDAETVTMTYTPDAPCRGRAGAPLRLERSVA